jgi:DNA-binding GntR family transcriptional regulator
VPQTVAATIDDAVLARADVSIFHLLQDKSGMDVAHADQIIDITAAPKAAAAALGLKAGRPVQRALRAYYTQDGTAIYSAVVHYHPENFKISMRFMP